jgi:hypothetical protein
MRNLFDSVLTYLYHFLNVSYMAEESKVIDNCTIMIFRPLLVIGSMLVSFCILLGLPIIEGNHHSQSNSNNDETLFSSFGDNNDEGALSTNNVNRKKEYLRSTTGGLLSLHDEPKRQEQQQMDTRNVQGRIASEIAKNEDEESQAKTNISQNKQEQSNALHHSGEIDTKYENKAIEMKENDTEREQDDNNRGLRPYYSSGFGSYLGMTPYNSYNYKAAKSEKKGKSAKNSYKRALPNPHYGGKRGAYPSYHGGGKGYATSKGGYNRGGYLSSIFSGWNNNRVFIPTNNRLPVVIIVNDESKAAFPLNPTTPSPTRPPTPTRSPTERPSQRPTQNPTPRPSPNPTRRPTQDPTRAPTRQ